MIERDGSVRQRNPRAERLLGLSDPSTRMLGNYSTELASRFADWCARGTNDPVLVRAPASGMHLSARFVPTDSTGRDVLVFLEDTERLQEQARQIKLAAVGKMAAQLLAMACMQRHLLRWLQPLPTVNQCPVNT